MLKVGKGTIIYKPVVLIDDDNHKIIIGNDCRIGQFSIISPRRLVMENGVEIANLVVLSGGGHIIIGKYSTISYGAKLIPATLTTRGEYMSDIISEKSEIIRGSIRIGEGAYIGAGAVICVSKKCPHIVIGDHAVIGALTYIDRSIPSNMIVHTKRELEMYLK